MDMVKDTQKYKRLQKSIRSSPDGKTAIWRKIFWSFRNNLGDLDIIIFEFENEKYVFFVTSCRNLEMNSGW